MRLDDIGAIWEKISSTVENGVFIIAEAGKNFIDSEEEKPVEEYLENAKKLVDGAMFAGADAIKFQTHEVEDEQLNIEIIAPHFKGADRYSWLTRNTLSTPVDKFWKPLRAYCEEKGIVFMSTPMSRAAARKLTDVGVMLWKIGSGDILDFVCMDYIRESGLPIIMSSGMSTFEEVEKGLNFLRAKNKRVALMHCLSKYPGIPEEANLATMDLFREKFPGVPIGFSENSVGIESSLIAVANGAQVIEKHFTFGRELWGSDHKVSSTPEEFKKMVEEIRKIEKESREKDKWLNYENIEAVRGRKEKILQADEAIFRPVFRKSLMAGEDIRAGTILSKDMLYAMRPQQYAGGLPSENYENVLGRKIKKDIKKYDPITENILE